MSRESIEVKTEDELRENTHRAVHTIANILHKSVDPDRLPDVFFDPTLEGDSFFDGNNNSVTYNLEDIFTNRDGYAVFEEAGHSLQSIIEHRNEKKSIIYEKKYLFFRDILREAFGYFCSRLSGEEREEKHLDRWEQDLDKLKRYTKILNNENEIRQKNNVVQIGKFMYKLMNIYLNNHPDVKLTDSFSYSMSKLTHFAMYHSENVKPQDISSYNKLFHCMGYDLGADLYNHFKSNSQSGISLVNDVLEAQTKDSLRVFMQVYNALRSPEKSKIK